MTIDITKFTILKDVILYDVLKLQIFLGMDNGEGTDYGSRWAG